MDIILMLIGIGLTVWGGKLKDPQGARTGGGIALMVIGLVFAVCGTLIFVLGFMVGFAASQLQ